MTIPTIKKYMLSVCVFMISAAAIHAQQRPSERSMTSEIQKINAKRAERNAYINRSQQTTATTGQATTTTSTPAQGGNTKPVSNTNTLPSQRPIQRPVKPIIRKATVMPADSAGRRPG